MNAAGNGTFLNISQNMDNIKKIQLASHYYDASLADTLKFSVKMLSCPGKIQSNFLGEICIHPYLKGNEKKIHKFISTDD